MEKRRIDWKQKRRYRGIELWRDGWMQTEIAQALGVTPAAVNQWIHMAEEHGKWALRSRPRAGSPRLLPKEELKQLPTLLRSGAENYGFLGDIWTCARIAEVIRQEFGVRYHKAHVSRLMKELNWTPQKPIVRALQRDEDVISHWPEERWPELKKSRA